MEEIHWYALGTSYCRELKLKAYFDARQVETYIPMKYGFVEKGDKRERVFRPAIHNLVFVRSDEEYLKSIKVATAGSDCSFRWLMNPEKKEPIEGITYFTHKDVKYFTKGDTVRIAGGPFEGVEGYLTRIHKDRCVVVILDGLAAVATTFVHPSMLEKIKE